MRNKKNQEKSACGVGFVASREQVYSHSILQQGLFALRCQEHRGACSADQVTGDGTGIMTDIPFELLGYQRKTIAVAFLFLSAQPEERRKSLALFEQVFEFMGLEILEYREVPICKEVLGQGALERLPYLVQAIIKRPEQCSTDASFDKILYSCKQLTRIKLKKKQLSEIFFASLSANTIVYKGLLRTQDLDKFYIDLQNPLFKTRFAMFHRRFSTNTISTWDKAQPFRLIGHNGEFNTITSNRSWAVSREKSLGLSQGELLTESGISDSGSLNEMVESLMYKSSIPYIDEILAIMMPPAENDTAFYKFWSRTMEPWDGPALITYSDGENIGARLDRNGFRPCRWAITEEYFYLCSEAGSFHIDESLIIEKGTLPAGAGVRMSLKSGNIHFVDPSLSRYNYDAKFDARTIPLPYSNTHKQNSEFLDKAFLFSLTQEEYAKILIPMIREGKEAIGSMGDTARMAVFSDEVRSFFDYFYHNFAQVTNPPLDYLREKMVTDLTMYLGKRPNIFAKKDLIPPTLAYEIPSPVLSLGQMEQIEALIEDDILINRIVARSFDMIFKRDLGVVDLKNSIRNIKQQIKEAVSEGVSIIILTDKNATYENPPIPSLVVLRSVIEEMRNTGQRLKFSIIVHSAEIRTTHQLATTIGMGAAAVCPYLALEIARYQPDKELTTLEPDKKEKNLIKAYENGLLKIMSKMGISVVRSYQSSQLFTSIGVDEKLIDQYFENVTPYLSGIGLEEITAQILRNTDKALEAQKANQFIQTYQFKEHNKNLTGEKHNMTNTRSKIIHDLVRNSDFSLNNMELFDAYLKSGHEDEPVSIRHLFELKTKDNYSGQMQSIEDIMKTFGSGAMSFGAISAESQRDIFLAMKEIGGRSNSGEGGENPYYETEGITAHTKQIASGRFGVNALYLVSGEEIQIKIAQGAKPGEGGQLMAIKVDAHIAKARHSLVNVDLISPPPMHDIYSIEDLKQLIYELKQLKPNVKVNVKLVSGAGIGTIAVGVAKAGADSIHISGGEGGTGAAPLSSMKHAGLPWELGLWEVHQTLIENNMRHLVQLRVDGGLHSGKEIVTAAILGAENFDFGKLMLVAEGCVMARICEKNTCPTGIATHDPRFKSKYKGSKEHIVRMMQYLAADVQRNLQAMGEKSLKEIIGRSELLEIKAKHRELIQHKNLDLSFFLENQFPYIPENEINNPFDEPTGTLNQQILEDVEKAKNTNKPIQLEYIINSTDRAVLTTLCGDIAKKQHQFFLQKFDSANKDIQKPSTPKIKIDFRGSAGQGFGAFMVENLHIRLFGEANDSVCKTMSGGKMVIRPSLNARFKAENNVIIGNCALYGATGGTLYVNGVAGDRFAVRNSGAVTVAEGVGLHACEYMTQGKVVILGAVSYNIGGGMTGGEVIVLGDKAAFINSEYLKPKALSEEELHSLYLLLADYQQESQSKKALFILENWEEQKEDFQRYVPVNQIEELVEERIL